MVCFFPTMSLVRLKCHCNWNTFFGLLFDQFLLCESIAIHEKSLFTDRKKTESSHEGQMSIRFEAPNHGNCSICCLFIHHTHYLHYEHTKFNSLSTYYSFKKMRSHYLSKILSGQMYLICSAASHYCQYCVVFS